jgi:hypothetical protein
VSVGATFINNEIAIDQMECECEKDKSDAKPVQKRSICNKVHNTNSTNRDYTLYTKKRFFPSIRAPSNIFCLECTCFLNH